MTNEDAHHPVLLDEVLDGLQIQPHGIYIDATYGRGGHAEAILARLGAEGRLIVLDQDLAAVRAAAAKLGGDERVAIEQRSFGELGRIAREQEVFGHVSGILLDLGVSSPQLDDPQRGFSFQHEGPLDMRMNPDQGETAAAWLARASEGEIAELLKRLGEERFARRIARAIVAARRQTPIRTTTQLAELVAKAVPTREKGKHPATRTFQAIRIHINRELETLQQALEQAVEVLAAGGRLVVISFHSLEDRPVKRFMRDQSRGQAHPRGLPVRGEGETPRLRVVGKPRKPGAEECARNPRARSAVLRVAEKVA